ncbi:pilus assembly FimT family protein [Sulfurimonas paralvinellae]|uniref:Type II secretion system protein n=1 Tax=Sulfurimonas paralvinellae TaxID=317658 RepID=A0A7M1B8M4_9BACT|nr:type II secretion system protein [Sulfurimonas paralvinellae]QOP46070.1 type II secretion system protein [Sulfurimonas paralvinellae]
MKKAFTLLELVFVIVVIGILAALILPRTKTNPVQEAAVQVLSHIRYTQHLALVDDKYNDSDANWYMGRWQIVFGNNNNFANNKPAYTIFADSGAYSGDPKESEVAVDPQNPNLIMTGGYNNTVALDYNNAGFKGMKELNLGEKYGITNISFSGGCNIGMRISFDYLGRPFTGDQSTMTGPYSAATQRLITSDCNISLTDGTETATVQISPETGYAKVIF